VRRALIERLEPRFLDLHAAEWQRDGSYRIRGDARRFENWETNFAGKLGLGVAADYALEVGIESIWERGPGTRRGPAHAARRTPRRHGA